MPIERLRPTFSLSEERLAELRAVVPEAFAGGRINFDTLREALGERLEDEQQEHFGLSWPGKREARRLAARPGRGTLAPRPGEGVNEDETGNIFIEGDNLEVLKLLQKSYAGRVKLIYIDPPYNTGNDFVYDDDYREPLEAYLSRTGQTDEAGRLATTNRKESGRFHSNWLSMMYPRLLLARGLLTDNGSIFVSIDDNEVHNLRSIMGEVFGEENFVSQIPWQSRQSVQNDTDFSINHEYIVCYAKSRRVSNRRLKEKNAKDWYTDPSFAVLPLPLKPERFSNPDNDPRGAWKDDPFDAPNIRPNLTYKIVNPNTGDEYWPPAGRCWRMEEQKYKELLADNRIIFGKLGESAPKLKVFYKDKKDYGEVRTSWFSGDEYGTTATGTSEVQALFDGKAVFSNPKPTTLLKELMRMATGEGDLILDFFAGSSSTAHAVLDLNREEASRRKFVCVQLPEPVAPDTLAHQEGFRLITEIGKERIRRAISKLNQETEKQLALNPQEDLGFRCYRLERSNFKEWQAVAGGDVDQLEIRFRQAETPLIDDWQPADLLVEILLMEGFPLDSRARPLPEFSHNRVLEVTSGCCRHRLYVCLDATVRPQTAAALRPRPEDVFICLDSALTDQAKIALADRAHLKVI